MAKINVSGARNFTKELRKTYCEYALILEVRFQCGDIDGSARTTSIRLNETTECVGNNVLTIPHGVPDEPEVLYHQGPLALADSPN